MYKEKNNKKRNFRKWNVKGLLEELNPKIILEKRKELKRLNYLLEKAELRKRIDLYEVVDLAKRYGLDGLVIEKIINSIDKYDYNTLKQTIGRLELDERSLRILFNKIIERTRNATPEVVIGENRFIIDMLKEYRVGREFLKLIRTETNNEELTKEERDLLNKYILKILNESQIEYRFKAINYILDKELENKELIEEVLNIYANSHREEILEIFERLEPNEKIIELLFDGLKDEDEFIRLHTAKTLAKIADKKIIEKVLELAKTDSWELKQSIAAIFKSIEIKDKRIINTLVSFLEDKDRTMEVGFEVLEALTNIKDKRMKIKAANRLLKLKEDNLALVIIKKLQVEDKKIAKGLRNIIENTNDNKIKMLAIEALAETDKSKENMQKMLKLIDDKELKESVIEALGIIGIYNEKVIDRLVKELVNTYSAKEALVKIANKNNKKEQIVEKVIDLVSNEEYRDNILYIVKELKVRNERVIDKLKHTLNIVKDEDKRYIKQILNMLGENYYIEPYEESYGAFGWEAE